MADMDCENGIAEKYEETEEKMEETGTNESFFCEICEENVTGTEETHEKNRLHKQRNNFKIRGKLKEELDATFAEKGLFALTGVETKVPDEDIKTEAVDWIPILRQPLLGMQYVFEIIQFDKTKPRYYACRLCGECDMPVFEHLISQSHRVLYLVKHYDEVKPTVDSLSVTPQEKVLLEDLIESKGFPKKRPEWSGKQINQVLRSVAVVITNAARRKKITVHVEQSDSEKIRARQPHVALQLRAQNTFEYPEHLLPKLHNHGGNFSLQDEAPKPVSLLDLPFGPSAPKKITLLQWLHTTAQKLDMEPLGVNEFEMCQRVVDLLKCGIRMYMSNPRSKEICFYPNPHIQPCMYYLHDWLKLTIEYFESAWLCSERELSMAQVLVKQIEAARHSYLDTRHPRTMGQAADMAASQDPYDALGYGEDFCQYPWNYSGYGNMPGQGRKRMNSYGKGPRQKRK